MDDDHYNVCPQRAYDADRQPLEEELPGFTEVQVSRHIRLFHRLIVLLFRERFAAGAQLAGRGVKLTIMTGCGDASDGEGDEVDEEQDNRIDDLQATLDGLGGGVGYPRQSAVRHDGSTGRASVQWRREVGGRKQDRAALPYDPNRGG